jgi:hypothetical protein
MTREAAAALGDAASVGPFFAVRLDPAGAGWARLADVAADPGSVDAAIARARERLAARARVAVAAVETRVAASVWHLGLAARVASPALAAAARSGLCPRLDDLLWRDRDGVTTLAVASDRLTATAVDSPAAAVAAIETGVVAPLLRPLTTTAAAVGSISEQALWGNVWSAFAGAAAVMASAAVGPGSGDELTPDAIVAGLVVAGAGPRGGFDSHGRYRRDTCCLYYRLPGGGLCGDCVLDRIPA